MASTFAFHPSVQEVAPYSADYSWPSQLTRSSKRTVKLPPKNNAQSYVSGSTLRFEFPASGYLNPNTTYLTFNCRARINSGTFAEGATTRGTFEFQNNIQSIFKRCRVLYGSLVIEDIQDFNILQRIFTEVTVPAGDIYSPTAMYQGIGTDKRSIQDNGTVGTATNIQKVAYADFLRTNYHATGLDGQANANVGTTARRYAIPINTGLFQQKNLLPLKFMASQLQLELEIADAVDCQVWTLGTGAGASIPTACQVEIGLPEVIAELLEFDVDYDKAMLQKLKQGLPIYFQSWHMTSQNITPGINVQTTIQESSRSVRYALAVLTDDARRVLTQDAHFFLGGWNVLNENTTTAGSDRPPQQNQAMIENFQWRLGGTYYPSQPVPCFGGSAPITSSAAIDSNYADPPVEAYQELMKVFGNQFADDGVWFNNGWNSLFGDVRRGAGTTDANYTRSFVMAGNFMTDRGDVISGVNAEEVSDMYIQLKFNGTSGGTAKVLRVAVCYDNLIILGENNNMVLIN